MTTRRGESPILDRRLFREVPVETEAPAITTFAYDARETRSGNRVDNGEWRRDNDTTLALGLEDSNGVVFPLDLPIPTSDVKVSWDGADPTILNITALDVLRNPFALPLGLRLTFGGALPAAGTVLTVVVATGGVDTIITTTQKGIWYSRRDFTGRDLLTTFEGGQITIEDSRFLVRAQGPTWDVGDTFTDDQGVTRTVRGLGQIHSLGRNRYLEILVRSVGG